jgi:hypothetical protein
MCPLLRLTSSLSTAKPSLLPNTACSRSSRRDSARSYCSAVSLMIGSPSKGAWASSQRMWAAAAMPNIAGAVPSTGMVRTRKLGTICLCGARGWVGWLAGQVTA